MSEMLPVVSDDPEIQDRYVDMRRAGESHNMAEILALRSPPRLNGTDVAFNRGRVNNNQFANCPQLGNYYRRIADRAGVSTAGKYYCHGLGRFPGDPKAWCSDLGDVRTIARERNLNIDGLITVHAHDVEPTPDVPLAEDIWERDTQSFLAEHPGTRYEDAREKIFNLRTGRENPHAPLVEDNVPSPDDVLAAEGL